MMMMMEVVAREKKESLGSSAKLEPEAEREEGEP
jgi:hypothetical protein